MKYSMGWFDETYLNTTPIVAIRSETGTIMAFANIVDEYTNREAAVDLMRYRSAAPPGTMDFLFSVMLQYARDCGYERFNLGLSGLAGVGITPDDPIIEHALHYLYENVKTGYNFKGLHNFKEKYKPTWEPRYLIYTSPAALPELAVALAQVSA
jgi:phosphatidylglycerol lysyltransferase